MEYVKLLVNNSTLPLYLTAIISFSVFYIKYKFDQRTYYNAILKEKLDTVYSPLVYFFKKNINEEKIMDNEIVEILMNKSHLVSQELLKDMHELLKYEESFLFTKEDYVRLIEYKNLRKFVFEELEKEYVNLTKLYNKEFVSLKTNFEKSSIDKFIIATIKICVTITVATILFVGIMLFGASIYNKSRISDNIFLNTIVLIYGLIVVMTIIYGVAYFITLVGIKILNIANYRKGRYKVFEKISKNGIYICRACNREEKFFRNDRFPLCKDHTVWQSIKSGLSYNWIIKNKDVK